LSSLYYSGKGVALDFVEAAKWARQAAEQGYARAETDLGYLYEQGKGVPLDYANAYRWYRLAAAGGDERSRPRMESLTRVMTKRERKNGEVLIAQSKVGCTQNAGNLSMTGH
jgi:TPR repeat protein